MGALGFLLTPLPVFVLIAGRIAAEARIAATTIRDGGASMNPRITAATRATIATGIGALLMLVPVVNALILIGVMLPLWVMNDIGVPGLGSAVNGFFVPSVLGWLLVGLTFWTICFVLSLGAIRSARRRQ